ncbi:MAG: hypothetical protein IT530_04475 [Burkholderiales bacterium]|nr:hypothetical protein [Burkholderiales bacterium]
MALSCSGVYCPPGASRLNDDASAQMLARPQAVRAVPAVTTNDWAIR